jgi:hypothetical protein
VVAIGQVSFAFGTNTVGFEDASAFWNGDFDATGRRP